MPMLKKAVKSSWVRGFAYDAERKILEVEFGAPLKGDDSDKPSNFGHYLDVDGETFDKLNHAISPGAHLTKHVIPVHGYKAGKA